MSCNNAWYPKEVQLASQARGGAGSRTRGPQRKPWQNRVLRRSKATPPSTSSQGEDEFTEFKSAVLASFLRWWSVRMRELPRNRSRLVLVATARTIRDRIIYRQLVSRRTRQHGSQGQKARLLSPRSNSLIGRLLSDVLCNLGLSDIVRAALGDLGVDPSRLLGRARRRARQWWSGTPRRLFPGEHGEPRHPGLRLWHSL